MLELEKGDLIVLDEEFNDSTASFLMGTNIRTGIRGHFAIESIYILPTLSQPLPTIIVSQLYLS